MYSVSDMLRGGTPGQKPGGASPEILRRLAELPSEALTSRAAEALLRMSEGSPARLDRLLARARLIAGQELCLRLAGHHVELADFALRREEAWHEPILAASVLPMAPSLPEPGEADEVLPVLESLAPFAPESPSPAPNVPAASTRSCWDFLNTVAAAQRQAKAAALRRRARLLRWGLVGAVPVGLAVAALVGPAEPSRASVSAPVAPPAATADIVPPPHTEAAAAIPALAPVAAPAQPAAPPAAPPKAAAPNPVAMVAPLPIPPVPPPAPNADPKRAAHFLALGRNLISIGQLRDANAMFHVAAGLGSAEAASAEAASAAILAESDQPSGH